jgi:hypothetical protein
MGQMAQDGKSFPGESHGLLASPQLLVLRV